mgnify:CR=1 FL=1
MEEELRRWDHLLTEAKAGRLTLDADVAVDCFNACNNLIEDFKDQLKDVWKLRAVSGFGGFDCAADLENMFKGLADEQRDVVLTHIKVVTQIRDTIAETLKQLAQADEDAAVALRKVYQQV